MSTRGEDSLPISALQHWLFCPRQCALIHVERLWAENRLTAEGRVLHARADGGAGDRRKGVLTLRAVQIGADRLGLHGVADVVEIQEDRIVPVEYKRGRPKPHRADEVQLCAQALCLEEMTGRAVPEGALYYGEARRRTPVAFDEGLRSLTSSIADEARAALASGTLPPPVYDKRRCRACSLVELCRPERMQAAPRIRAWLERAIASQEAPEGGE
ncbi:CRISPR-associated protein Cas4 [Rhodovulum strictum]|uniref:CRISPR-associated exonuclease Cas4 n=1 Tax=Rhodovulum strictum TaxID=58314 RepID=A0A844BM17_9RHOB|nr:CRISPR-associated protein Cas4 [Rhodovulum strictum]MRH22745.1 CRISPR-associated protein Cas4 [Rhodovulum strictum]